MKKFLKFAIIFIGFLTIEIFSKNVYADTINVNVNFDGQKIEMTSETPEMTLNIANLLPGEENETVLKISNIGKKTTDVEYTATLDNETDSKLADILNIRIIKLDNELNEKEEIFYGKYIDLSGLFVKMSLDKNNFQYYKIITSLPEETGNEFQSKECKIKFNFIAKGIEDIIFPKNNTVENNTVENKIENNIVEDNKIINNNEIGPKEEIKPNEITTNQVKSVKTGDKYIFYLVMGIIAFVILIAILIIKMSNKKDEKNK